MSTPTATKPYKAVYAGVVGGLVALTGALADGHVSPLEVVGVVLAAVVAGGGTYGIKNPPA